MCLPIPKQCDAARQNHIYAHLSWDTITSNYHPCVKVTYVLWCLTTVEQYDADRPNHLIYLRLGNTTVIGKPAGI